MKDWNKSGRGRTICAFFTHLDNILWCRPASASNNVVASLPGPSDVQDCSTSYKVDKQDVGERGDNIGEREDNKEEEDEQNNNPANESIILNMLPRFIGSSSIATGTCATASGTLSSNDSSRHCSMKPR